MKGPKLPGFSGGLERNPPTASAQSVFGRVSHGGLLYDHSDKTLL